MSQQTHPLAGSKPSELMLVDLSALLAAYYERSPDPGTAAQRVAFGTSGHRGSSLTTSFNEQHVLAITQAICNFRQMKGYGGPLFLGFDTHALSRPAMATALEVLAGNDVDTLIAENDEFTPTPAISHAILQHNRDRVSGLADGIVLTPSHNPPETGGYKYNPPHGGPAEGEATRWIETEANRLLRSGLTEVRRTPSAWARNSACVREHDFIGSYVGDLGNVVNMKQIRCANLRLGVDPLGGAGLRYWARIADQHRLNIDIINDSLDPCFGFMPLDWDGRIRMDPSSAHAMRGLLAAKDRYDVAFACDPDHDRHGIVVPSSGLMPANHFLSVAADYLYRNREEWSRELAIGKTVVSTSMLDKIAHRMGRPLYEVPVGFKWFVDGLSQSQIGFACEESAGASFLRRDESTWTTDKDGIAASLLAAEITAQGNGDPGEIYQTLSKDLGVCHGVRIDAPASVEQKQALAALTPAHITRTRLADEPIWRVLNQAPGNDAALGGIKVCTRNGWFAARPSGTEAQYKIYAESFRSEAHLARLVEAAQQLVAESLAVAA